MQIAPELEEKPILNLRSFILLIDYALQLNMTFNFVFLICLHRLVALYICMNIGYLYKPMFFKGPKQSLESLYYTQPLISIISYFMQGTKY